VTTLLWLLLALLFGVGGGGSAAFGPTEPAPKPTPIVLRSGDQRFVATRTLPSEGAVDFELESGKRVDVAVRGSHSTRRVVSFESWACSAPGARVALAPGQATFRVPRLEDGPYKVTVTSGKLHGVVMAAVFSGIGSPNC
jgi:hypothetical protein